MKLPNGMIVDMDPQSARTAIADAIKMAKSEADPNVRMAQLKSLQIALSEMVDANAAAQTELRLKASKEREKAAIKFSTLRSAFWHFGMPDSEVGQLEEKLQPIRLALKDANTMADILKQGGDQARREREFVSIAIDCLAAIPCSPMQIRENIANDERCEFRTGRQAPRPSF